MNTNTAGNAVRHGLSGLRHMPKGREAELGPIELDLIECRLPETPEQLEIVHELAFAMWQKSEHERVMVMEADKLAVNAGDLFDQKALEDYQKLHKLWLENPMKYTKTMIRSKLGVEHFLEIWQVMIGCLKEGFGISLPMAISAVRTEGCSPSPHFISGPGNWIITRAMAFVSDVEDFVEEWLELVQAEDSKGALARANLISKEAPELEDAYQQLCERVMLRVKHYTQSLEELSHEYDQERQGFIDQYSVNVMSSPEFEKQLQRMHRYRVFTENRIKELNRRLANIKSDMLKKERQQDEKQWRQQMHDVAVAQLRRPQFEQLMEYRNPDDAKTANLNSNPEPPRNEVLTAEDVDKMPTDWQNQLEILPNTIPNADLFSLWTNDQLNESDHLIAYLVQLPTSNKHWIEQIKACQEYEYQLRSLTVRNRE
jgi:hypothetical protein